MEEEAKSSTYCNTNTNTEKQTMADRHSTSQRQAVHLAQAVMRQAGCTSTGSDAVRQAVHLAQAVMRQITGSEKYELQSLKISR